MAQALDLDRRNVDAWVARGAAYANQHAFPKAISDFQTALGALQSHAHVSICSLLVSFCAEYPTALLFGGCAQTDLSTAFHAEIEPDHVNASKYLRATEQHMVQLGIPTGASLQAQQSRRTWNTAEPAADHAAADTSMSGNFGHANRHARCSQVAEVLQHDDE